MAKFGDTYTLDVQADARELDAVVDALRDTGKATDYVGDMAAASANDVRRASKELEGLDDAGGRAARGVKDVGEESESTGGILAKLKSSASDALGVLMSFAGLSAVSFAAVFGGALDVFTNADAAMNKFQAQTGTRDWQMDGLEQVMEDIYTSNWGESFDDIAQSMATVRSLTGNWDPQFLQDMTTDALILRDVFDWDVNESVRAANQLMVQFGEDGGASFDMLTQAAKFYGDPAQDLLDTVNEYSSTFTDMGFTAEEMMSILGSGVGAGAYNYDVVADSIREMNIRLQDGTSDLALWSLGLDGMKTQWKNGEISSADFFRAIQGGLRDIEDPLERQRWGVELFGTKWEDMGDQVFLALDTYSDAFYDLEDSTAKSGEIMSRGLVPAWNQFLRITRVGLSNALEPYLEAFVRQMIPAMTEFGNWLTTVGFPMLALFFGEIADGVGYVIQLGRQTGVFDTIGDALTVAAAFIGTLVGGIGSLKEAFDRGGLTEVGKTILDGLADGLANVPGWLYDNLIAPIGDYLAGVDWANVVGKLSDLLFKFIAMEIAINVWLYDNLIAPIGDYLAGVDWAAIPGQLDAVLGQLFSGGEGGSLTEQISTLFWGPLQSGLGDSVEVQGVATKAGEIAASVLGGLVDGLGDMATFVYDHIIAPLFGADSGDESSARSAGDGMGNSFLEGMGEALVNISTWVLDNIILPFASGFTGENVETVRADLDTFINSITSKFEEIKGKIQEKVIDPVKNLFAGADTEGSLANFFVNLPQNIATWISGVADAAASIGQAFLDTFFSVFSTLGPKLVQALNDAIPDRVDFGSVNTPLGSINIGSVGLPANPIPIPSMDLGGRGRAGVTYFIGRGAQPELFTPDTDGTFTPRGGYGAAGITITGDVYFQGVQDVREMKRQLAAEARRQNQHGGRGNG